MSQHLQLSTHLQTLYDNVLLLLPTTVVSQLNVSSKHVSVLWKRTWVKIVVAVGGILIARKVLDIVRRKWYKYPPGPVGIPLLGTVHEFADLHKGMNLLGKYGPIYMTHFGMTNVCFINDSYLLKKHFMKKEFCDRNDVKLAVELSFGDLSVAKGWAARRKLLHECIISPLTGSTLFDVVNTTMNNTIFPIIDQSIDKRKWDVRQECNYIAFVVIFGSIFGADNNNNNSGGDGAILLPKPDDELFIQFNYVINEVISRIGINFAITATFAPISKWMESKLLTMTGKIEQHRELHSIVGKWIKLYNNRKGYKSKQNSNKNENESENKEMLYYETLKKAVDKKILTSKQAEADMILAFQGGTHTTGVGIEQCILYLTKCGIKFQNELFEEISNYGGNNLSDMFKNRNKMIKYNSFIYEVTRMHAFTSITAPRVMRKNYKIDINDKISYIIPKNALVFGNISSINWSGNYWGNNINDHALEFNPKRFIDSDGKLMKQSYNNMVFTFGCGRRNCAGQALATKEIYLVTGFLIKRYQFNIPNNFESNDDYHIPLSFMNPNTPKLGVTVKLRK